ncbi:hypothetical protein KEJ15_03800, partial [Candidatus Bathyarchaeota archaeon]|nr:hypothetical protein [Candidatus Bathyarchaeota archaeon]
GQFLQDSNLKKKLLPFLNKKDLTNRKAEAVAALLYEAEVFDAAGAYMEKLIAKGKETLKPIRNSELFMRILESTYPQ